MPRKLVFHLFFFNEKKITFFLFFGVFVIFSMAGTGDDGISSRLSISTKTCKWKNVCQQGDLAVNGDSRETPTSEKGLDAICSISTNNRCRRLNMSYFCLIFHKTAANRRSNKKHLQKFKREEKKGKQC